LHSSGPSGGVAAGGQANQQAQPEGTQDGIYGKSGNAVWWEYVREGVPRRRGGRDAESDTDDPADAADEHCFEQKMSQDRTPSCSDRASDADFAGSLGHCDEHDIG